MDRLKRQVLEKSLFVEQFQSDMNNAIGFVPRFHRKIIVPRQTEEQGPTWIEPQVRSTEREPSY